MNFEASLAFAQLKDKEDKLAAFKHPFYFPQINNKMSFIYLFKFSNIVFISSAYSFAARLPSSAKLSLLPA